MFAPIYSCLTEAEVEIGKLEVVKAAEEALLYRRRDGFHATEDKTVKKESGYMGEIAFYKGMGTPWKSTLGTFKGADYGNDVQIRTAPCKARRPPINFGNLIVRPDDFEVIHHKFVLVVGNAPYFVIKGWILGTDACVPKWWKDKGIDGDGKPAWLVPHTVLIKDMSSLVLSSKIKASA